MLENGIAKPNKKSKLIEHSTERCPTERSSAYRREICKTQETSSGVAEASVENLQVKIKVKSQAAQIPPNAEKLANVCLYRKAPFDEYKNHHYLHHNISFGHADFSSSLTPV